jgi:hypothetical protein
LPLSPPPEDEHGKVKPHDHAEIGDVDIIIRRISEQQLVTDKNGTRRISSVAFKAAGSNAGMSVDIEKLIVEAGKDPKEFVTTPRWTGSVWFAAGQLRKKQLLVGFNPVTNNPFHGEVWGIASRPIQKAVQECCQWYVEIPGVSTS